MNWHFHDSYKHKGQRRRLVSELMRKGIANPLVLEAIENVPRHLYLEDAFGQFAYQDKAFPIGEGQTISQPFTVARQTELLQLKADMKVLEIGTGSGYQSAVLLELGANLCSVEVIPKLHRNAKFILKKLGYQTKLFCQDGSQGLPEEAPFDRILVTAGAPVVPQSLLNQLKTGGKLVIPVGNSQNQQMLRITRKSEEEYTSEAFEAFAFVPLVGKEGWKKSF